MTYIYVISARIKLDGVFGSYQLRADTLLFHHGLPSCDDQSSERMSPTSGLRMDIFGCGTTCGLPPELSKDVGH